MDSALPIFACIVLIASAPPLLLRVRQEYARDVALSQFTVWSVWLYYVALLALIVLAAITGRWELGLPSPASLVFGVALVATGAAIDLAGVVSMGSFARMNGTRPDRLITAGAFSYSRNPQNVGIGIAAIGVSLIGDSGLALAVVAWSAVVFRIYLVFEEAHLGRTFGRQYADYQRRVPRYLGAFGR